MEIFASGTEIDEHVIAIIDKKFQFWRLQTFFFGFKLFVIIEDRKIGSQEMQI